MGEHNKVLEVPFEEALDTAGVGAYSYRCVALSSLAAVASACVCYSGSILVPAGACELRAAPAHQAAMLAAPFVAGVVGTVVWGALGDRRGRRRMQLAALAGAAALNAAASLATSWPVLLVLQCFSTFLASGVYPLATTLLSESVPLASRDRALLVVSTAMLCSQAVMAGLAIPIIPLNFSFHLPALGIYWNSWRTLMLSYSLPAVIVGVGIWLFIQESPKFVLAKGDGRAALRILKTIHRINKAREKFQVQSLLLEEIKPQEKATGRGRGRGRGRVSALFRAPLRKHMLICTLLFISMQFVGGLLIWLPKISNQFTKLLQTGEGSDMTLCDMIETNLRSESRARALDAAAAAAEADASGVSCSINVSAMLMMLAVCSLQFVANGVLALAVGRFGRRSSVTWLVLACGASGALVAADPSAPLGAALYGLFLVGIIVVGPYTAIVVSLFPTDLRSLAVGMSIMGGRLSGFFTIQMANYLLGRHCRLGFLLFSAVFAGSALLLHLLPSDAERGPRASAPARAPADPDVIALTPLNKLHP